MSDTDWPRIRTAWVGVAATTLLLLLAEKSQAAVTVGPESLIDYNTGTCKAESVWTGTHFIVVWGVGTKVLAAVVDAAGTNVQQRLLASSSLLASGCPRVAFGSGLAVVVFRGDGGWLQAAIVDPTTLEVPLLSGLGAIGEHPVISYQPNGNFFLVAWQTSDSSNADILAQRLQPFSGDPGGITTIAAGLGNQLRPRVARHSSSSWLVVWSDDRGPGRVYGQLVNLDGTLSGGNFQISNDAVPPLVTVARSEARIAGGRDGSLVAWYHESSPDPGLWEGKFISTAGSVSPGGFVLSNGTLGAVSSNAEVAFNETTNQYLAVWQSVAPQQLWGSVIVPGAAPTSEILVSAGTTPESAGVALGSSSCLLTYGRSIAVLGAPPTAVGARPCWMRGSVSVGAGHSCQLRPDGTLWCWGANDRGQLGDDTLTDKARPAQILAFFGGVVAEVSAGWAHTLALLTDNTGLSWGYNDNRQLGDGTTTLRPAPVRVSDLAGTGAQVSAGYVHTCARKIDGTLWCWGDNRYGQLGDESTSERMNAVQVALLGDQVAEVSAGAFHTCARKIDGTLWCWGDNRYGQLGDGTTISRATPAQVMALGSAVTQVTGRALHVCARKSDGGLWCWGDNQFGGIGDGTTTSRSAPTQVLGLDREVAQVATGDSFTCAVETDSTAWCWGFNSVGQLGDGTTTDRWRPVRVLGLGPSVATVSAGMAHSCARTTDGRIWCWGNNSHGQLGNGTTTDRTRATPALAPVAAAVPLSPLASGACLLVLATTGVWLLRRRSAAGA